MSITNSKNITQTFSGLQVLLIESHKGSLHRHANQLIVHSHRVTRTTKASIGLSKILDGEEFHCVFIDSERCEMDIMEFLHCSLKNQPKLPIVVMGPYDIKKEIEVLAQTYKVVSFLQKPYLEGELCYILKQLSKGGTSSGEGSLSVKCVEKNLESNIEHKVDTTLVGSSATPNATMIYNSLSSGDGTDNSLINISSQEYGSMSQPITIVDVSGNDDEPSIQKNICIGKDKGKKPMEVKRRKYLSIEGNTYLREKKEMKTHNAGVPALDVKFTEALNAPDKKNDYPDTILQGMNVPGFTRSNHFASQLQEYKEKENNMKKPTGVSPLRKVDTFQAENSYAYTGSGIPTPSTSIPENSNLQRPLMCNSEGISYMTLDNIRARLNGATPLTQKTTTTATNSGVLFQPVRADTVPMSGGFGLAENPCSGTGQPSEAQTSAAGYEREMEPPVTAQSFSNHVFGKAMPPLDVGATVVSQFDRGTDNYMYLNDFANANSLVSGGSIVKESFTPLDCFGVPVDQRLLNTGYAVTGSSNVGSENLYFQNMESLFDVGSPKTRNFSDTDAATIGDVSASLGIPEEEKNSQTQTQPPSASIVPLDSSASRLTEEHWSEKMIQHEPEIFTEDVSEYWGELITGPIGYTEDIVDHW